MKSKEIKKNNTNKNRNHWLACAYVCSACVYENLAKTDKICGKIFWKWNSDHRSSVQVQRSMHAHTQKKKEREIDFV